jgi:hypothetical protein
MPEKKVGANAPKLEIGMKVDGGGGDRSLDGGGPSCPRLSRRLIR